MKLTTYRQLDVWQRAVKLVETIYMITSEFPNTEKYGLTSQLQRAGVSIPANIAEGYGRMHRGEYVHHLSIARGSLFEVETLLALSVRLKLATRSKVLSSWNLAQETGKMLTTMIGSLRCAKPVNPNP